MADKLENIFDYRDAINARPESKSIKAAKHFKNTLYIFNRNYDSLAKTVDHFIQEGYEDILFSKNRHKLNLYLREVIRHLHNTVSGAITLRDHAIRFYEENYQGKPEFKDYQCKIDETFSYSPVVQFVHKLRNYTVHHALPPVGVVYVDSIDGPETARVTLNPGKLLEAPSWWNREAKEFLLNPKKFVEFPIVGRIKEKNEIDLRVLISRYKEIIDEFYEWLGKKQVAIHTQDLKTLGEFKLSLAKKNPELILLLMRQELSSAMRRDCSFADVFEPVVSAESYVNLAYNVKVPRTIATLGMREARLLIEIPNEIASEIYNSANQLTDELFDEMRKRDDDKLNKDEPS